MTPDQTPAEEYRELAGRFTEIVEGVPDQAAWNRAAPVEGWNACDVVRHLVEWFPPFLQEGAGITLPAGPDVDDDPAAAWRVFNDGVQAVLDDPTAGDKVFSHPNTGQAPYRRPWRSSSPPTCLCTAGTWRPLPVRTRPSTLNAAP